MQGDPVTKDTQRNIDLEANVTKEEARNMKHHLYSCSLDDAPEYNDHERQSMSILCARAARMPTRANINPGVERVGTVRTAFSSHEMAKVPHKRPNGFLSSKRIYHLSFDIVVEFGKQSGTLEFKSLVGGAISGTTTVTFE